MQEIARFVLPETSQRVAPFSDAVRAGDLLFVTGQVAIPPGGRRRARGGLEEQMEQVIATLKAALAAGGGQWERAVFARIHLVYMGLDEVLAQELLASSFPPGGLPACSCVGITALPGRARVMIDLVVAL